MSCAMAQPRSNIPDTTAASSKIQPMHAIVIQRLVSIQ